MYKFLIATVMASVVLIGCTSDADLALRNNKKQAEDFKISRAVSIYNTITGEFVPVVTGNCSFERTVGGTDVICKVSDTEVVRHFVGMADNAMPFIEQLTPSDADYDRYIVYLKPSAIIPNVELR